MRQASPRCVRQVPALQWRSLIEGHDLALDERQVMNRIKRHVTRVIGTRVVSDRLSCATDHHTVHEALNPNLTVAIGNGH